MSEPRTGESLISPARLLATVEKAAKQDLQTAGDRLRYSTWLAAVSAGGIGILAALSKELSADRSAHLFVVTTMIFLLLSMATCGFVNRSTVSESLCTRNFLALMNVQAERLELNPAFLNEYKPSEGLHFLSQFSNGAFNPETASVVLSMRQRSNAATQATRRLLLLQEVSLFCGYLVISVAFARIMH